MSIALLVLLVAALVARPVAVRSTALAGWVLPLPFLAAGLLLALDAPAVLDGEVLHASLGRVDPLDVSLGLRLDGLGLLFGLLVCAVGAVVVVHAAGYLAKSPKGLGRFAPVAFVFGAAMLGLVVADDLILLFVCWELTSICSFLLVGTKHESADARSGALRALTVTGAGGIAMLVGLLLLASAADTTSITTLLTRGDVVRESGLYVPALVLIGLGALTKSAQVPFHYWLPGAMAAPSPVSAFLHSATLVKAGVFLLLRLHPVLGFRPEWHLLLVNAGALTMLLGAVLAFAQDDLKKLLAYTTVSGLGALVLLIGIGTGAALRAALLFVAVHALYKASLFMVTGFLDLRTGTRNLSELRGLARVAPFALVAAALAAFSMSGLPPLLGAIAKELVYEAKLGSPFAPALLAAVGTAANGLVIACAIAVVGVPFFKKGKLGDLRPVAGVRLLLGPVVLASLGLALGIYHDTYAAPLVSAALAAVAPEPQTTEFVSDASPTLVAWLGKTPLALGAALFVFRGRLLEALGSTKRLGRIGPTALHDRLLDGLAAVASRVSAVSSTLVVRRSLLLGLGLLVAVVAVPFARAGLPEWPASAASVDVHEGLLIGLAAAGALAAVLAQRSLVAVTSLGATGFSIGMLFLLRGGPDLALTQVSVEILTVLLLLFALRGAKERRPPKDQGRVLDVGICVAVGAVFTLLAWSTTPDGSLRPLAAELAAASEPRGFGRNVVNVILVDFRALDTLGEIFVLAIAACGVVALVAVPRQPHEPEVGDVGPVQSPVLRAAVRSLFPVLGLLSVVLVIRGHHEPGGGFVAGLVAAAAVLLAGLVFGFRRTGGRFSPDRLIAYGLAIAVVSGLVGTLAGDPYLTGVWLDAKIPTIGKLGTPLLFDIGVFLVVLGVSTRVLSALLQRGERAT